MWTTTSRSGEGLRFIQLTPPGSNCSVSIGEGITEIEPGSLQGLQLVVDDIEAARDELVRRGLEVSDVQDFPWGRCVFFSDPDGNGWAVQQIPDYGEGRTQPEGVYEHVQDAGALGAAVLEVVRDAGRDAQEGASRSVQPALPAGARGGRPGDDEAAWP